MKQILLLLVFSTALTFSSCKKCWTCNVQVDGGDVKTCDKEQMESIEAMTYSDSNGNVQHYRCR